MRGRQKLELMHSWLQGHRAGLHEETDGRRAAICWILCLRPPLAGAGGAQDAHLRHGAAVYLLTGWLGAAARRHWRPALARAALMQGPVSSEGARCSGGGGGGAGDRPPGDDSSVGAVTPPPDLPPPPRRG